MSNYIWEACCASTVLFIPQTVPSVIKDGKVVAWLPVCTFPSLTPLEYSKKCERNIFSHTGSCLTSSIVSLSMFTFLWFNINGLAILTIHKHSEPHLCSIADSDSLFPLVSNDSFAIYFCMHLYPKSIDCIYTAFSFRRPSLLKASRCSWEMLNIHSTWLMKENTHSVFIVQVRNSLSTIFICSPVTTALRV